MSMPRFWRARTKPMKKMTLLIVFSMNVFSSSLAFFADLSRPLRTTRPTKRDSMRAMKSRRRNRTMRPPMRGPSSTSQPLAVPEGSSRNALKPFSRFSLALSIPFFSPSPSPSCTAAAAPLSAAWKVWAVAGGAANRRSRTRESLARRERVDMRRSGARPRSGRKKVAF